ncbi:MAG: CRTAC1 family protein [Acidobacteriota bacterium]
MKSTSGQWNHLSFGLVLIVSIALGLARGSAWSGSQASSASAALNVGPGLRFSDVAARAGLDFKHVSGSAEKKYLPETFSGGVAWIDFDGDGWPDLYLVNGGRWEELLAGRRTVSNALYRNNRNGTFANVTKQAGVGGKYWGMGATVGDYDNDGWPDLYVCNYGPNLLYRNNGDGTFSDVTTAAGVGDARWSSSAAFADYDGDGNLDLYVTNYVDFNEKNPPAPDCQYRGIQVHCGPKGLIPAGDTLYRNNGDGTFTDVTRGAGMSVLPAYGLGVIWGDYDNDGDPDVYVANDSVANFLFQNQGDGTFKEIGGLAGLAYNDDGQPQAGMGVTMGDFDHDGNFDFFVTNFSDDYNTLYRNLGKGVFRDVSYASKVAFPSWRLLGWGTGFLDFDHDGWEDLFVSNGHVYPQVDRYPIEMTFTQPKLLYRNQGNGRFEDVTAQVDGALTERWSGRGAAFADFDNDGDLDIAVNNMDSSPSLLANEGGNNAGHWIILSLEGTHANRSAVGTRVTVETPGNTQIQELHSGSSYQACHDLRLHFGLGENTVVKELRVRWPGGEVQKFGNVSVNRGYALKQGETLRTVER